MNELISIVDDEPDILELVSINLIKSGFKTEKFLSGEDFLKSLSKKIPDLIILDLMLPDIDGIEICKYIRSDKKYSSIPIIMLTARADETDKIIGLELGADDYVTKPFSPKELVARVKAILRRKKTFIDEKEVLKIGEILIIDLKRFEVYVEGKKVSLTPTEFNILKILAAKKGWVLSREQLLDALWGKEKFVLDRTIDVHIRNLRKKLKKAGGFIKNIRGVGYKIEE